MTVLTFVGATLQGAIGFGMGLLAAPLLILLDPRFGYTRRAVLAVVALTGAAIIVRQLA